LKLDSGEKDKKGNSDFHVFEDLVSRIRAAQNILSRPPQCTAPSSKPKDSSPRSHIVVRVTMLMEKSSTSVSISEIQKTVNLTETDTFDDLRRKFLDKVPVYFLLDDFLVFTFD
jgi:hypothetical protein